MSVDWLNPAALAALAAGLAPIVVHLLRRQHAPRLSFPSLRFVVSTRAAAIRAHAPTDLRLMALRIAIVAAAAMAWAQPALVGGRRGGVGNDRLVRAVVLDTSVSMTGAPSVQDAIRAQRTGAAEVIEGAGENLAEQLAVAVQRMLSGPPARREIVVISDFAHGSLTPAAIARVPDDVGLRFVAIDSPRPTGSFEGLVRLGGGGVGTTIQRVTLDGGRTAVAVGPSSRPARSPRIVADAPAPMVDALVRAVSVAGAPAPSPERPVAIAFGTAALPADPVDPRQPWMVRAIVALRSDAALAAAADAVDAPVADGAPWVVVARNRSGQPVVAAAAVGAELTLRLSAAPSEYVSAAALRALLLAASPAAGWPEREVERIPRGELQRWTRAPGPVADAPDAPSAPGDARILWVIVLLLIGLESFVRRRATGAEPAAEVKRAA